jgi:hypothetical protein
MFFTSIAATADMATPDSDQTSDADKVVVFTGHSVIKGPKSFSETSERSDDDER